MPYDCIPTPGTLTCQFCGWTWTKSDTFPHRNCPEHPEILKAAEQAAEKLGEPGLLKKGAHYAQALAKWFAAGCPTRTQEEAERLEGICRACDKYDLAAEGCKICGCSTSSQRWAIKSKVKMATEHCPHPDGDKWVK
jgi:hypothetical protein